SSYSAAGPNCSISQRAGLSGSALVGAQNSGALQTSAARGQLVRAESISGAVYDGRMDALSTAYAEFLAVHPDYAVTHSLDALRADDYARLDAQRHTYLDYTGAGLYAESQIRAHAELLD